MTEDLSPGIESTQELTKDSAAPAPAAAVGAQGEEH